jgi:hypothetical protein
LGKVLNRSDALFGIVPGIWHDYRLVSDSSSEHKNIQDIEGTLQMKKDTTICFQTSSEIRNSLEKIAEKESRSVPSVVESIICHYLKNDKAVEGIFQNRRRFERKKITIPAYIGYTRWQHDDFVESTIMDISLGGIKMSIPKGAKVDVKNVQENEELSIIFRIPSCYWPISVKISPQTVFESAEEIQLGASLINPDFQAYSALQKYLM